MVAASTVVCAAQGHAAGSEPSGFDQYFSEIRLANQPDVPIAERQRHADAAIEAARTLQTSGDADTVMAAVIDEAYAYLPFKGAPAAYALLVQKAPGHASAAMTVEYAFILGALEYLFDPPAGLEKMNTAIAEAGNQTLQTHFIRLRDARLGKQASPPENETTPLTADAPNP